MLNIEHLFLHKNRRSRALGLSPLTETGNFFVESDAGRHVSFGAINQLDTDLDRQ